MVQFSSIFNGLTRSISIKNAKKDRNDIGREASNTLVKEAKKNDSVLSSPGTLGAERSANFASVFSKRGKKGINQDCFVVWKEFGCQEDMTFCGVFDGHGPWGHLVSKRVRKLMPPYLLCNWQETLALNSLDLKFEHTDRSLRQFDTWKQSYLKTFSAIDQDLEQHPVIDSFHSGSTALTMIRQGDLIVIANVGDSRAVLATVSDNGNLVPVQLTVDLKPNLPEEIERITQSKGRIFSSHDEARCGMSSPMKKQWGSCLQHQEGKNPPKDLSTMQRVHGNVRDQALQWTIYLLSAFSFTLLPHLNRSNPSNFRSSRLARR
ncbi:protein phosphatase 2C family protein [Actinidia rufa]|uniref:Protein phosphatase 2C family protein n=1 Tax=Actinidia rufa TaxID=165716 RepID=A0A7J0GSZ1_9ERIC|nr:protein phosphatase 2C family protein [Actinidia rufa]